MLKSTTASVVSLGLLSTILLLKELLKPTVYGGRTEISLRPNKNCRSKIIEKTQEKLFFRLLKINARLLRAIRHNGASNARSMTLLSTYVLQLSGFVFFL